MVPLLGKLLLATVQITLLVGVMMIAVDLINIRTGGREKALLQGKSRWRQYVIASLIGTAPGCVGGFTNVSLYMHGLISFGALAGSMIAVSGDEAFVMLALFPKEALLLFGILFVLGILGGWLIDAAVKQFHITTCENCGEMITHSSEGGVSHYFRVHVYEHVVKKHLGKTALWTFGALAVVEFGLRYLHLEELTSQYKIVFLLAGAVVGLIPESGPHLIFVTLFAQDLIPFSVLLTSSIVQDGHGMLPMLSFSVGDSAKMKLFNLAIGLAVGLSLYAVGY